MSLTDSSVRGAFLTGGRMYAKNTRSSLCTTGVPQTDPKGKEILHGTCSTTSRRGTVRCEQRLRSSLAESQEAVHRGTPAVRGVHEGRTVRKGNGRRPHRPAPWRPEALLGQKQLAGSLPSSSQHEDEARGPDAGVPVSKQCKRYEQSRLKTGIL